MSVSLQPTIYQSLHSRKGTILRSPVASIYGATLYGRIRQNPPVTPKTLPNCVFNAPMYHCHPPYAALVYSTAYYPGSMRGVQAHPEGPDRQAADDAAGAAALEEIR
jgi:hypothetical protein